MRIGLFTDSYRPYKSGVVYSIDLFTKDLIELGHEIKIFAPNYPHCEKDGNIFRFASIPAITNPGFSVAIPVSIKLRKVIKRINPEIIHVHSPFLLGRLGARYARNLGVPLVFTFHTLYDMYTHYVPIGQDLAKFITRRYCIKFCNECDLVIVPTSIIADYLTENGVKTKIINIPTGIDLDSFIKPDRFWLQKKHGIPDNIRILLCVGRLGQEKNHKLIFDVYAGLMPKYPDTRLILVGGGPEEENLRNYARQLGIYDNVIFTGAVEREEAIKYYCSSHIFVFGSVTETQGLVIGEAKAAGLPSVAVRAFGVSEMVRDGEDGFLTENSVGDFTEKLERLLSDRELWTSMSAAALENAKLISSKISAEKLAKCYEELIYEKSTLLHRA